MEIRKTYYRVLESFRRYRQNRKAKKIERYYRKNYRFFLLEALEVRGQWDTLSDAFLKNCLEKCEGMWSTLGGSTCIDSYYHCMHGGVFVKGYRFRYHDEMFLWRLREESARRALRTIPIETLLAHAQDDSAWLVPSTVGGRRFDSNRAPHLLVKPDTYKRLLKEELDRREKETGNTSQIA